MGRSSLCRPQGGCRQANERSPVMIERIEALSREDLLKRIMLMADLAMAVDGLWFLAVEKADGFDKALAMDVEVWERYARLSVKRIKKHFPIASDPLEAIKDVISYDPLWYWMDFEFVEDDPRRLVFRVNTCPALEAMERMGREVLTCEPVEGAYLAALAETVDRRIRVKPLKLPPRKSPDEVCCSWMLSLQEDDPVSIPRGPVP